MSGHLEIVKRLKPDPKRDDLSHMLERASFRAHPDLIGYLLDLGANPNDKPDGGSSVLDGCIQRLGWEDFDRVLYGGGRYHKTAAYKVSNTREAIRTLVARGAKWSPDAYGLSQARRIFLGIDAEVTVEFAGLLLNHRACDEALLHKFLRTPAMQLHISACERQLARLGLTQDGRRRVDVQTPTGTRTPSALRHSEARSQQPPTPSWYMLSRYDRKTLYKEVWAEPTQKVAARYGVSDVALSKACKQLNIPKPPRGFWAKKAAGQPVPRRPKLMPMNAENRNQHDRLRSLPRQIPD
jgi:hypothetical protein